MYKVNYFKPCNPIQKSQPNFPNPEETYPGVGSNNKAHTHCRVIICRFGELRKVR